jgi:hypothetical protein
MSSFEALHFDPSRVSHVDEVREYVLELLANNGGYKPCDFSCYTKPGDIDRMKSPKIQSVIDYAWDLVHLGASRYLGFPKAETAHWLTHFTGHPKNDQRDFETVVKRIPAGYDMAVKHYEKAVFEADRADHPCTHPKPDPADYDVEAMSDSKIGLLTISQRLATVIFERIETDTHVRSMEMNFLNYRKLRPDSPCAHDPVHVFRRLQNPEYEMSDEDLTIYLATYRGQAFSNMMAFATNEIKGKVIQAQDAVLAISNAYTSFKDVFALAAETVAQQAKDDEPSLPTVRLGSELDGLKM